MTGQPDTAAEGTAMVRVNAIRRFDELVRILGGDPAALLSRFQLDLGVLGNHHATVPYRTMVNLLERTAEDLACPDFGMRLARLQSGAKAAAGPLEIVMRNSRNLSDAFSYSAENLRAYSTAARLVLDRDRSAQTVFIRLEILLARLPWTRQAVEHALLQMALNVHELSGGLVRPKEVRFVHQPGADPSVYRAAFGCPVHFGASSSGLLFNARDFQLEIMDPDPQLYEIATSYIETRFPAREPMLSARVRTIAERLLLEGECSFAAVASELGIHPRTLQRRLRAEGDSFEAIKDGVRRDVALRYLRQTDLPLTRVAEILGYSETSVLSRSCYRWFSASPRQLRLGQVDPAVG